MPEVEKTSALETLMTKHALSETEAESLLHQTDSQYPHPVNVRRMKTAFSGRPSLEPISVNFPVKDKSTDWLTGLDIDHDLHTSEVVDSLQHDNSSRRNRDFYPGAIDVDQHVEKNDRPPSPNARDIQLATQAAQSGQREFVSSQMLMSLLREIDDDGIISKYISIFEKACDSLGRLYMQVLWRVVADASSWNQETLRQSVAEHGSILQCLHDDDLPAARASLLAHIDSVERYFKELLSAQ
jgi:hypothetical protein